MGSAFFWGALAASSLALGALIGLAVSVACALATPLGYALIDITSDEFQGGINGFAAGALPVMLVDPMIPDATEQAGRTTGLVTALGFAVGAGLSFN